MGGHRVWSLMISLFGDLAQGEADVIEGPALSAIMDMMAVRPAASRVALHRLRNDGWIRSQKKGRISLHSLTDLGRQESEKASPRIYADPDNAPDAWQMVLLEESNAVTHEKLIKAGYVQLLPRLYCGAKSAEQPPNGLALSSNSAPGWLRQQLAPQHLAVDYTALERCLSGLADTLPDATDLSPVQNAALRCLVVHNWRRIVLKHPPLPRQLISDDWSGLRCQRMVNLLLTDYPRPPLIGITAR